MWRTLLLLQVLLQTAIAMSNDSQSRVLISLTMAIGAATTIYKLAPSAPPSSFPQQQQYSLDPDDRRRNQPLHIPQGLVATVSRIVSFCY